MAKILIIEDEKSINDLIMMNLKLVGHDCFQAYDGKEAVTALQAFKPELVILDITLPYIDGFCLRAKPAFGEDC